MKRVTKVAHERAKIWNACSDDYERCFESIWRTPSVTTSIRREEPTYTIKIASLEAASRSISHY